jgi:hypothetical protein
MMKNYSTYINEMVNIDNPFKKYPINVNKIYSTYHNQLIGNLREYYSKFIGKRVTVDGNYYRSSYSRGGGSYGRDEMRGPFTFIVKKLSYKLNQFDQMSLYFSDGKIEYQVWRIMNADNIKSKASLMDPYAEEDWNDNVEL